MTTPFVIRPAETRDLPLVGRLAGQLVRLHHATDPARFLLVDGVEELTRVSREDLGRTPPPAFRKAQARARALEVLEIVEMPRPRERLDAYPHRLFRARLASISPGTGSSFSLLPAENATGNWVKVTQRVPLRCDFVDPIDVALASGLSANVKVDTQHVRHLFGGPSR